MGFFQRLLQFFRRKPKPDPRLFERTFVPVDHPLRPELDQRYLEMRAAMASGDRLSIASVLAPHFVSVDIRGEESSAEQMIDLVLAPAIDRSRRLAQTTLISIEESHGIARIIARYSMSTTAEVSADQPKELQTLSADTWLRSGNHWLLAKTQALEIEVVQGAGLHRYVKGWGPSASKRFPLFVNARIWEHVEPLDRGARYEDPLEAFLIRNGLGEMDGGGTQLGKSSEIQFVDVTFWLRDSDEALAQVTQELCRLGAPAGSELQYVRNGAQLMRPFGETECLAIFLDGVTLPSNVYATSDVNIVLAHLAEPIERDGIGEFRAHWRGNRETALFFNGTNAEAMLAAMMPQLSTEPLCQNARVVIRYGHHPLGSKEVRLPLHSTS